MRMGTCPGQYGSNVTYETSIYIELAYSKSFNGDRECCREEEDLVVSWEEQDQLVQCVLIVH